MPCMYLSSNYAMSVRQLRLYLVSAGTKRRIWRSVSGVRRGRSSVSQEPQVCKYILEVSDTIALQCMWDDSVGNCRDPYTQDLAPRCAKKQLEPGLSEGPPAPNHGTQFLKSECSQPVNPHKANPLYLIIPILHLHPYTCNHTYARICTCTYTCTYKNANIKTHSLQSVLSHHPGPGARDPG